MLSECGNGRIRALFASARASSRCALIPYIVAGDPVSRCTPACMHALVAGGADLIELGIPFSDPEADGPDIQAATERALAQGTTLGAVLDYVRSFRAVNTGTPVALMGYLNSIERMGYDEFAVSAAAAGVDAVIIVNMPPEEGSALTPMLAKRDIDTIYLLAPNTNDLRVRHIAGQSGGFVYCVSLQGTTGAAHLDIAAVNARIRHVRTLIDKPVAVGFGIRDGASARAVATAADAVVIGSELVRRMGALAKRPTAIPAALQSFMAELRQALDEPRQ